jgi:hypothetical protein
VTYDVSQAPDLDGFAKKAKEHMEAWHPYLSYVLRSPNYTPSETITMYFDPNHNGVAYAEYWKSRIVGGVNYYRSHQDDVGSMIHEMVHVIQNYNTNTPSWIWEGIADYERYYEYNWEGNRKPSKPSSSQSWTDGYGVTAYFLNYVVTQVRDDMVYWVNKDAREGTYQDTIWPRLTGKNLSQLWADMQARG